MENDVFDKKVPKENITVPLDPAVVDNATKLAKKYKGLTRTEILRFAVNYALDCPDFHKKLDKNFK